MTGHWRRLFIQAAILVSMLAVNAVNTDIYVIAIALTLLALPVASWTVFGLLLWTSRQAPDIQSLHERVDDALTLAISATAAAAVGTVVLGHYLSIIGNISIINVLIGFIVVEVSIPAVGFLRTWRDVYLPMVRGKRDRKVEDEADSRHINLMEEMEKRLTAKSQEAIDHADAAYQAANTINEKIASVGITDETVLQVEEIHEATVGPDI